MKHLINTRPSVVTRPHNSILVSFFCLIFTAQGAFAQNYVETLATNLREHQSTMPEEAQKLCQVGMRARTVQPDQAKAIEAYTQLASEKGGKLNIDQMTYALAELTLTLESANKHPIAMKKLEQIRALRTDDKAKEIRYLVDLEIARLMAQCGGSIIPDFNPTFSELEAVSKRIFDNYSPYRQEVLKAHLELAMHAKEEVDKDRANRKCLDIAINQLKELASIIKLIHSTPVLAHDEATLKSLSYYAEHVNTKLPRWLKKRQSEFGEAEEAFEPIVLTDRKH